MKNKILHIYAADMPVAEDGPVAPPTPHRVTLLADSMEAAQTQAEDAGMTLLGQIVDQAGTIKPP